MATTVRSVWPNWLTAVCEGTTRSGSLANASTAGPITPTICPHFRQTRPAAAIDFRPEGVFAATISPSRYCSAARKASTVPWVSALRGRPWQKASTAVLDRCG